MSGWIGVDLDGTLAHYDGWKGAGHIGQPIAPMMARLRAWLAEGKAVKIFTARVGVPEPDRSKAIKHIHEWLEAHGLPRLDITNVKTLDMEELWDDRAVQVERNTGAVIQEVLAETIKGVEQVTRILGGEPTLVSGEISNGDH